MSSADQALVALGRGLRSAGYRFTTPTPETHRRVLARGDRGNTLTDLFGWSRTVPPGAIPADIERLARAANILADDRSLVRFSTVGQDIFVHSAFPTTAANAVFFGPDTYRFIAFLRRSLAGPLGRLVDVGCGSGAGGIVRRSSTEDLILADINADALRYAAINAAIPEVDAKILHSDVLASIEDPIDTIVANPPYLVDDAERLYRHGGEDGIALATRIIAESRARLSPGGRLALYSGTPVVDGTPLLIARAEPLLGDTEHAWEEIDPDVFGEELDRPVYANADRIAVYGLVLVQPGRT